MYNYLTVNIAESIATVTFHDVNTTNEFTAAFSQELIALADELYAAEHVKVVVVRSGLESFSVGMNGPAVQDGEVAQQYHAVVLAAEAIKKWSQLPYPIIAAVQGVCSSIAFSFITVADIRIIAENACFSMPEITWGAVPAGGITQRLPRIIGKGPATAVLLGAKTLDAEEAAALGLTTAVVPVDALWAAAAQEAEVLAKLSTLSLQYTKECLLRGSELGFQQGLRLEMDVYMTLQTSHDRMEGVTAFLEKRAPQFTGE